MKTQEYSSKFVARRARGARLRGRSMTGAFTVDMA